ncbi:MAG: hypothetical protein EP344_12380 [Bacteroidetes bacterium]|nr:MAG: hypothetical protein EP344_12380 [Bacteroidota bacterium]
MNPQVDLYFTEGCGRCPLGGTPDCKVHKWPDILEQLRLIVLDCGLTEEIKWGVPCYTNEGNNILLLSAFKDYCSLSFFKGALLQDPIGILEMPGPNSQAARLIRFTDAQKVLELEPILKTYIAAAIEVEKSGLKVQFKKNPEPVPEELQQKLDEDPVFRAAFEALTPGRQRGYILHFSAPKQSKTRESRIEKCMPQILSGKGLHDR